MDHRLDSLSYMKSDYDKYMKKESRKILYGRTSREFGCIEGEYSVLEIDGKRLLEEIK